MLNPARRIPALVLLVVLALLPLQAWTSSGGDSVIVRHSADGMRSVTWAGTVSSDGRLAVRITYDFGDDSDRTLDVRVPEGARLLAVDGRPIAADIGRYAEVPVRSTAAVTYELPGVVTRYSDGAVLTMLSAGAGHLDGDFALFPCPRCYVDQVEYGDVPVYGVLYAENVTDAGVWATGIHPIRSDADAGVVRFVGVGKGDAVSLVVRLPSDAVPSLATTDGSARDAIATARGDVESVDEKLRGASDGDAGSLALALILTLMFLALVSWIAWRFAQVTRQNASVRDDSLIRVGVDAVYSKPSDLEPALAGLTVGHAGSGERSVVAGTLLELARRGVITIDGIDSRRFALTVPPGAKGDTVFEEAVLAQLRPQGQLSASATITGPPLWGPEGRSVARKLARVLYRVGLKRRLIRFTLSALVLVPASVAMGIVALIGSGGLSALGWFAVFAGPVLAILAGLLTGVTLTAKGREERRRWLAYADWLRSNTQLAQVGAPGVAAWGEVLPHAAALGAAPVAAEALSPR